MSGMTHIQVNKFSFSNWMRFSSNTVVNWLYFRLCLYYADTKCEPYTEHMIGCAMRQQGVCCSRLLSERVSHVHVHCVCSSCTRCHMCMCMLEQEVSDVDVSAHVGARGVTPGILLPLRYAAAHQRHQHPLTHVTRASYNCYSVQTHHQQQRVWKRGTLGRVIGPDFERVEGRDNSVGQLNFLLSWMMTNWTLWEPWKFKIKFIFFSAVLGFGFILHIKEGLKRGRSNC